MGLVLTLYSAYHWIMQYDHLLGLQRVTIQLGSQGMPMGQSACSGGGETDSSTCKWEKPGGCWWSLSWHKGKFLWWCSLLLLWCSWLTRGGTPTIGSTLGVSDDALHLAVGTMGSLLAISNILSWPGHHSQSWGWSTYRALLLLCRASPWAFQNKQCTSGGPWPVP